ncbi:MAG: hypothetical protein EBR94_01535, partial [Bacteroidetes bacterium]|nr:hypothetical protein [Bacteroidota bacterium]
MELSNKIMKKLKWIFMLQLAALSLSSQAQVNQSAPSNEEDDIASPKDSVRKKVVKLPTLPSIPKKVLSAQDSIAQINHHSSRYIFAPSAYPINKGSFYYQNYDLLLNDVQMGITDN